MLKQFAYGGDGSLTLYVQKDAPGGGKEANWLPAPMEEAGQVSTDCAVSTSLISARASVTHQRR